MKKVVLAATLTLTLAVVAAYFAFERAPEAAPGLRSGTFDPPRAAPDFTLDGSNGKKVQLREYAGKVIILEFGYASCQYVCPITLARLKEVYQKLGKDSGDVKLIFVTVDPERDTPEHLRDDLATFNPHFLGATGAPDEIATVEKAYGIQAERVVPKTPGLAYEMEHSSFLTVIDRQGNIRELAPFMTPVDDLVHDLEFLLKTPA
jgi:protein SCO1/2